MKKTPTLLVIMDGWGSAPPSEYNAVANAHTPHFDALVAEGISGTIGASEEAVGLPEKQMGNSEVGHMNIGGGRVPAQVSERIREALMRDDNGVRDPLQETFMHNAALQDFINKLKRSGGACHLSGIYSNGNVHGDMFHINRLAEDIARSGVDVHIHAITDGRDTGAKDAYNPKDGTGFIADLVNHVSTINADAAITGHVQIASLTGRYFAMDRDKNWDRVERFYNAVVQGEGFDIPDAFAAMREAYDRGETDENMQPTVLAGYDRMQPHDGFLFTNYRPDRARQIMAAFTEDVGEKGQFPHKIPHAILGVANYWDEAMPLNIPAMFDMETLANTLAETLQKHAKTQYHIAETEKYAHVTSFFDGNNPAQADEVIVNIPSPAVATYDMQPEMSAPEVTKTLIEAINSGKYDFLVVNYANPDMVGHTGNYAATIKAVECVDAQLGLLKKAIDAQGGHLLVTADHGNADNMRSPDGEADKKHTLNHVPFVVHSPLLSGKDVMIRDGGSLCDIAPTILTLMGLAIPKEMTGVSLIAPRIHTKVHDVSHQDTVISASTQQRHSVSP
jgi:2,3-bisphosphoglycerate-independent phosphoglycerate mutase